MRGSIQRAPRDRFRESLINRIEWYQKEAIEEDKGGSDRAAMNWRNDARLVNYILHDYDTIEITHAQA